MELKLETKFIEGTNNQYSIRNDGVVMIHYQRGNYPGTIRICKRVIKPRGYVKKNFPDRIIYPTVIIRAKPFSLKALVLKYFPLEKPEGIIGNRTGHKDGNTFNCSIDNLYYLDTRSKNDVIETTKKRNQKHRDKISESYISSKLGIKVEELPKDLYEAVKTRVLIKRKLKQLQNGQKEPHL